jgi:hypothetical protein
MAAQLAGKITLVEGRVDILRAGAEAAAPVKTGDTVSVGDILRTKSDGRAEITFIDQSIMTVGPKSRLGIEEYLFKPDEQKRAASLNLYRGKTGFQVPKPVYPAEGSKFEMKTKTAVAGVRGTEGILYTDGIERVYVKDGTVEFKNPLGSVTVSKGEVGEVFHGKPPVERPYNEKEYKKQEEGTKPKPPVPVKDEKAPPKAPPPAAAPKPAAPPAKADAKPAEPGAPPPPGTPPPPPGVVPPPPTGFIPPPGDFALAPPPPEYGDFALLPPPPGGFLPPPPGDFALLPPPPVPITSAFKIFGVGGSIMDGEIQWEHSMTQDTDTAAIIKSVNSNIYGGFEQTLSDGGLYFVNISGEYTSNDSRATFISDGYNKYDDEFHFFFKGNTSDGKPFYGGSAGDVNYSTKTWDGGLGGWIEDGSKKWWFIGGLKGSYNNPICSNTLCGTNPNISGTFSAETRGVFWDDSIKFWDALVKLLPTLPQVPEPFGIPITESAQRLFDISLSGSLNIYNPSNSVVGALSINATGQAREQSPGTGLFDMKVTGSGSAINYSETFLDIKTPAAISGTNLSNITISGGIQPIDSGNTSFIIGAGVEGNINNTLSGTKTIDGLMIGKMTKTGTDTSSFDGRIVGGFPK